MSSEPMLPVAAPSRRLRVAAIVGGVAAILIVAAGIATRAADNPATAHLDRCASRAHRPSLDTSARSQRRDAPVAGPPRSLSRVRPQFARVSGYLKSWRVDIGAHVKAGELMAEIETPDLTSNCCKPAAIWPAPRPTRRLPNRPRNAGSRCWRPIRWSRQEVDERTADYTAKQALVQAAKANVDRLVATKGFARIVAPFDGCGHGTRNRCGRVDQCRQRQRPGAVRGLGCEQAARLCAGSANLRADDPPGHHRATDRTGISGPEFPGHGNGAGGLDQRRFGYDPGATAGR